MLRKTQGLEMSGERKILIGVTSVYSGQNINISDRRCLFLGVVARVSGQEAADWTVGTAGGVVGGAAGIATVVVAVTSVVVAVGGITAGGSVVAISSTWGKKRKQILVKETINTQQGRSEDMDAYACVHNLHKHIHTDAKTNKHAGSGSFLPLTVQYYLPTHYFRVLSPHCPIGIILPQSRAETFVRFVNQHLQKIWRISYPGILLPPMNGSLIFRHSLHPKH